MPNERPYEVIVVPYPTTVGARVMVWSHNSIPTRRWDRVLAAVLTADEADALADRLRVVAAQVRKVNADPSLTLTPEPEDH